MNEKSNLVLNVRYDSRINRVKTRAVRVSAGRG